ncbi:UvrB/UvrC motif-containing protein [Deinococcus ficus]|uniref:UvrB/UvrC motif-containing protein n=1 Tax=Deinococcus ficus TaxID=317577 RepID=UPI001E5E2BAA|nr:UvrB/UvrC motif-containing protein [Deinococcus ficus]
MLANLTTAALGRLMDEHQAIVFRVDTARQVVFLTGLIRGGSEEAREAMQDIADELWALISPTANVHLEMTVDHRGPLELRRGDCVFLAKQNVELLFTEDWQKETVFMDRLNALERELLEASLVWDFERAAILRDQFRALEADRGSQANP